MRELSHSDRFAKQEKVKKKVNSQRVTWHSLEVTRNSGRGDMWQVKDRTRGRLQGQSSGRLIGIGWPIPE
jgi:hypothetical protein